MALPDQQRALLAGYLERCRERAPGLRWVSPDNLHLTLRFLGSVEAERLDRLGAGLQEIPFQPFEVQLGGLGAFGPAASVRVVWLGVEQGRQELERLSEAIEERCQAVGFEAETRPFNPHLTLARARERRGARLPELPAPPKLPAWTASGFHLFRSQTGPGGAVYSILASFG